MKAKAKAKDGELRELANDLVDAVEKYNSEMSMAFGEPGEKKKARDHMKSAVEAVRVYLSETESETTMGKIRTEDEIIADRPNLNQKGQRRPRQKKNIMVEEYMYEQLVDIRDEALRAQIKFPDWPVDVLHAMAILAEEHGEANKAALEHVYQGLAIKDLRGELVQEATMCLRMIHAIDLGLYGDDEHLAGYDGCDARRCDRCGRDTQWEICAD